jgi:glucan endo-1,6-beta-glucosidase
MIQVINEPLHWDNAVQSLRSSFYPNAYNVSPQAMYSVVR